MQKKLKIRIILLSSIFYLFSYTPVYAYLDPVTINAVVQFIILVFASIITFFSVFFKKTKNIIKSILKIFKKKRDN
jgi:hypothetical protein